jgi:hypothetical protein
LDGQFKQIFAEQAGGEEENLEVLDVAGGGVGPHDDIVRDFFGLLFGVWLATVDIQDVRFPVIGKSQFTVHKVASFLVVSCLSYYFRAPNHNTARPVSTGGSPPLVLLVVSRWPAWPIFSISGGP